MTIQHHFLFCLLALGPLTLLFNRPAAADEPDSDAYLTPAGQLTAALEVRSLQGGFAGFTGRQWNIEPSGRWTAATVFNQEVKQTGQGMLSNEELAVLAGELAMYDLLGLPAKEGQPVVNPRIVEIRFGVHRATLSVQILPEPDKATIAGRFSGIVAAVKDAVEAEEPKAE